MTKSNRDDDDDDDNTITEWDDRTCGFLRRPLYWSFPMILFHHWFHNQYCVTIRKNYWHNGGRSSWLWRIYWPQGIVLSSSSSSSWCYTDDTVRDLHQHDDTTSFDTPLSSSVCHAGCNDDKWCRIGCTVLQASIGPCGVIGIRWKQRWTNEIPNYR